MMTQEVIGHIYHVCYSDRLLEIRKWIHALQLRKSFIFLTYRSNQQFQVQAVEKDLVNNSKV